MTAVRIEAIDVGILEAGHLASELFRARLASPMSPFPEFAAARGSWMWPAEKVVTRIRDAAGREGASVTSGGSIVAAIVGQQFRRLLLGRDADDIDTAWEIARRSILPFDRSGFAMMAVAAIDIALWDLRALRRGCRLRDLLGNPAGALPRRYVTTMHPERFAGSDFSGIKVPMPCGPADGTEGIAANLAAIAAARAAAGDGRDVMLDAFMAWDVDYTLRMLDVLRPHRVRWFEDPLPPDDIAAHVRLKHRAGDALTLALGNFAFSRWDCKALLDEGVVSILQPDVAWAGGITETLRIVALARDAGVPVILHNGAEQPWAVEMSCALDCITELECVDRDGGGFAGGLFETVEAENGVQRQVLSRSVLQRLR
jgi:L-rhamnonate dehydratase